MTLKARRDLDLWRDASEAHIRSDLKRASNEARSPKNQRISLTLQRWIKASNDPPLGALAILFARLISLFASFVPFGG